MNAYTQLAGASQRLDQVQLSNFNEIVPNSSHSYFYHKVHYISVLAYFLLM